MNAENNGMQSWGCASKSRSFLLYAPSQLVSVWLFSLVSKPGLELANQREDGLNCWGSFTLATTSSSAQLSLCNIHREPQLPEPWKG